jgi:hypothetical protein
VGVVDYDPGQAAFAPEQCSRDANALVAETVLGVDQPVRHPKCRVVVGVVDDFLKYGVIDITGLDGPNEILVTHDDTTQERPVL